MYDAYHKYRYEGPILIFDRVVTDYWKGETSAVSEQKAKCNLSYQAKKHLNLVAGAKLMLPGQIKMVN